MTEHHIFWQKKLIFLQSFEIGSSYSDNDPEFGHDCPLVLRLEHFTHIL